MDAGDAEADDEVAIDEDADLAHGVFVAGDDGAGDSVFAVVVEGDRPGAWSRRLEEFGEGYAHGAHGASERKDGVHEREGDADVLVWPRHALQEVGERGVQTPQERLLRAVHLQWLVRCVVVFAHAAHWTLHDPARLVSLADVDDEVEVVFEGSHVNLDVFEHVVHPLAALRGVFDFLFALVKGFLVALWQAVDVGAVLVAAAAHWTAHVGEHKVQSKRGDVERVLAWQHDGVELLLIHEPAVGEVVKSNVARVHLKNLTHGIVCCGTPSQFAWDLDFGIRVPEHVVRGSGHLRNCSVS